jgi:hypothetical protein
MIRTSPADSPLDRSSASPRKPVRNSIWIGISILGAGVLVLLLIASRHAKENVEVIDQMALSATGSPQISSPRVEANGGPLTRVKSNPSSSIVEARPGVEPSARARLLVQQMSQINALPGQITAEEAEKWKRNMLELIEEGNGAVPVLREFFESAQNLRFDTNSGPNLLDESTLRTAFIKVLFDIPARGNVELQEQILRATTDPAEVALLARQLELQEPGVYKEVIVKAVTSSLEKAKHGEPGSSDTAPLLEILAKYGVPISK